MGSVRTDARMLFVDGERLTLVEGRTAKFGSLWVTASAPVSLEWSFVGEVTVEAKRSVRVTMKVGESIHTFKAPAGRSEHTLPRLDAGLLRQTFVGLENLPDRAPRTADVRDRALIRSPALKVRTLYRGDSELTDARALKLGEELTVAVGMADGEVLAFSGRGAVRWRHRAEAPIHSIAVADVDRDGRIEVIAGSDDAHTYLFDHEGKVRWAYRAPPYFGYWSHYASHCESRKVAAADLDGDGRDEILAAIGNLKLYVLSADGAVQWTHEQYGTPTMFAVADVNGDGVSEVVAGVGDFGCNSNCFVLRATGEEIWNIQNDGWSSKLTAMAAAPLHPGEPPTILCGTSKAHAIAWRLDGEEPKCFWRAAFGDVVSTIAALPPRESDCEAAVIVGSASDYLSGISADGRIVWTCYLAGAPTAVAAIPTSDEVLVGTSDGWLYRFEGRMGKPLGHRQLAGPVAAIDILKEGEETVAFIAAGKTLASCTL